MELRFNLIQTNNLNPPKGIKNKNYKDADNSTQITKEIKAQENL